MKRFLKFVKVCMLTSVCALLLGVGIKAEAAAPSQVTGLKQVGDSSSKIAISWNIPGGDAHGYLVEWCQSKSFSGATYGVGQTMQSSAGISGLKAGSSYYVRVRAFDSYGNLSMPSGILETVTAPSGKPSGLKQTKAESKAVTFSWGRVSGANTYKIGYAKYSSSSAKYKNVGNVTSYKLKTASNAKYAIAVCPARKSSSGYVAYGENYASRTVSTLPSKISKVKLLSSGSSTNPKSGVLYFSWGKNKAADGYQYVIYGSNGKKICTKTTKSYSGVKVSSKKFTNTQFMRIKVRGYVTVNGKKKYGSWSSSHYFAKFPNIKCSRASNGIKLSWSKVKGAKNYSIYVSQKSDSGYKKVKTTSSTKYTLTKYGKSSLKSGKKYYIKVVANKKTGGKTYQSDKSWRMRIYYY